MSDTGLDNVFPPAKPGEPTWYDFIRSEAAKRAETPTDDECGFVLGEMTAWPVAGDDYVKGQIREFFAAPDRAAYIASVYARMEQLSAASYIVRGHDEHGNPLESNVLGTFEEAVNACRTLGLKCKPHIFVVAPDGTETAAPLHIFDVYGGEEETVIAYDAADAKAVQMELGIAEADLEGAVFRQFGDAAPFTFCEDEARKNPVTKTCAEWAKEKGRGFFSTTYT